jgi:hypothetical protein
MVLWCFVRRFAWASCTARLSSAWFSSAFRLQNKKHARYFKHICRNGSVSFGFSSARFGFIWPALAQNKRFMLVQNSFASRLFVGSYRSSYSAHTFQLVIGRIVKRSASGGLNSFFFLLVLLVFYLAFCIGKGSIQTPFFTPKNPLKPG